MWEEIFLCEIRPELDHPEYVHSNPRALAHACLLNFLFVQCFAYFYNRRELLGVQTGSADQKSVHLGGNKFFGVFFIDRTAVNNPRQADCRTPDIGNYFADENRHFPQVLRSGVPASGGRSEERKS